LFYLFFLVIYVLKKVFFRQSTVKEGNTTITQQSFTLKQISTKNFQKKTKKTTNQIFSIRSLRSSY